MNNLSIIQLGNEWYIEVETDEYGKVLLLDKNERLPVPVKFKNEKYALIYMEEYKKLHGYI